MAKMHLLNISMLALFEHGSMLTLAFSSKHSCASVQPQMAVNLFLSLFDYFLTI